MFFPQACVVGGTEETKLWRLRKSASQSKNSTSIPSSTCGPTGPFLEAARAALDQLAVYSLSMNKFNHSEYSLSCFRLMVNNQEAREPGWLQIGKVINLKHFQIGQNTETNCLQSHKPHMVHLYHTPLP